MTAPAEAAAERWRQDLGDAFGCLEPEAIDSERRSMTGHGLDGSLSMAPLGRAGFFSVRGSPQIVRRTSRSIAAAPADPLKICIQLSGRAAVHQAGRELLLEPGQLGLYDTGRPYDLHLSGPWSCAVVTVPRGAIDIGDSALDAAFRRAFSTTGGPGTVLAHLCAFVLRQPREGEVDASGSEHLGEAGIELVASLLDAVPRRADDEGGATCPAVLGYVRAHLRDPGLSHTSGAAAHHVSPRTLNRIFESHAESVTEAIRRLRLEAARRELMDPRWQRASVMALAARWGFRDQGHFTRAFKAEFDQTPAAFRRAHRASSWTEPGRPARD